MSDKIKIAENLEEVTEQNLPTEILENTYLKKFAEKMMFLSNRLNEIDDDDNFADDLDIKEDYLPAIREFIWNVVGM